MKAKLISKWGKTRGAEHQIGGEATIGRAEDNSVRINAKPVSSHHARIYFDDDRKRFYLEDLGSLNGTELDGTVVHRAEPLDRLHLLRFGGAAEFLFVEVKQTETSTVASEAGASAAPPDAAAKAAASSIADSDPAKTRADIEVPELPAALREESGGTHVEQDPVALPEKLAELSERDGGRRQSLFLTVTAAGETHRFELEEGENVVGRSLGAEIRLSNPDLSRRHAVVTLKGDRVTVRDLGSHNKTLVGEVEVEGEVELQPGDIVSFGTIEARLLERSAEDTLPIEELPSS